MAIPHHILEDNARALLIAVANNNLHGVRTLLPISDPSIYSTALADAAKRNHIDIVEILLPLSDPKENNSYALRCAAIMGHAQVIDLLYAKSDGATALAMVQEKYPNSRSWERLAALEQQRILHQHLPLKPKSAVKKI